MRIGSCPRKHQEQRRQQQRVRLTMKSRPADDSEVTVLWFVATLLGMMPARLMALSSIRAAKHAANDALANHDGDHHERAHRLLHVIQLDS